MNKTIGSNNITVFPIFPEQFILYLLFFVFGTISSAVGIGGGGLYIPLFILLSGFELKTIIPLVVISILANSFIRMVILIPKKHIYNENHKLIDYFIASQIMCFDASGSYIGYYLNTIIETYVLKWLIFTLLLMTGLKTLQKARQMYKIFLKTKDQDNEVTIDGISIIIPRNDDITLNEHTGNVSLFKTKLLIIGYQLVFIIFFVLRYIFDNNIIVILCQSIFSLISGCYVTYLNYKYQPSINIKMNLKGLIFISFCALLIGILSTMLGIGGGMLVSPLLLLLKVDSNVVMATNSMTTFFSALTSSLQYIIVGNIKYDFMLMFLILSGISSKLGLSYAKLINNRCSSSWPMILFLGIVILIAGILIAVTK